jgi:hypothetical protein
MLNRNGNGVKQAMPSPRSIFATSNEPPMSVRFPIFVIAIAAFLTASVHAAEWHVSPSGNDAWSGSLPEPNAGRTDGPVATLERARDAIRERRKAGLAEPVTVFIHAGN